MNKYFLSVFVRLFLEKKEKHLMKFISDFQKLTVSDEKVRSKMLWFYSWNVVYVPFNTVAEGFLFSSCIDILRVSLIIYVTFTYPFLFNFFRRTD